jgi:eukaryotic-like serine/threonine-protein kinase
MKNLTKNLIALFTVSLFIVMACKKDDPAPIPLSPEKTISAFSFSSLNPAVTGTISGTNVTATVPFGTNLNLAPTITVSAKATVSPSSGSSQDFSKSVAYTVTAEDGSKLTYNVAVSLGKSPEKDILTFAFNGITPAVACTIDATTKTISATLPAGTDATKLVPTLTLSPKASVSPATGVAQDFSKEVSYTVTAEDASTQVYKVKIDVTPTPTSLNDLVFIGSNDKKVYALDASTGEKKWEFLTGDEVRSSPTYVDGVVYVGSTDKKLYALDAKTGAKKWEFLTGGGIFSTPLYYKGTFTKNKGTLFFGSEDKKMYSVDAATGTKNWEFISPSAIYSSPIIIGTFFLILSNSSFSKLTFLTVETGEDYYVIGGGNDYKFKSVGIVSTPYSPTAGPDGIIYTVAGSSDAGNVHSLYSINVSINWEYKFDPTITSDRIMQYSPTYANGVIYVTDIGGRLHAVDAKTGIKKWRNDNAFASKGHPIVVDNVIYCMGNSGIVAYNTTDGAKKWTYSANYSGDQSVAVANGIVYYGGYSNKKVVALDTQTGKLKWEFLTGGEIFSSPCVLAKDGKVFYPPVSGMQE